MRRRARRSDERGLVLILVAVAMLAILVITAMAIDLGAKRAARRSDQTVADLASLAAGSFLAGYGSPTVVSNPFLACKGALVSAETNEPAFNPTQDPDTTCAVFPTNAKTGCSATTAPQDAVFSDAAYVLTIRYPIPDSELSDARFAGGTGINDGTNRCERMKVTFASTANTQFAGIIGVDSQTVSASSVVRASTPLTGQGVAAMVSLERLGCGALQNSGQGSITVRAPTPNNPGVIQADTAGQSPPCTTNNNPGGFSIYGSALPASAGGGPSIIAETSSNGVTGIIGIYAITVGGRGGAVHPGGLSVAPTGGPIASRQPVDDKYNGTSHQISDLHADAWSLTHMTAAEATAAGYTVISGTQCSGTGSNIPPATAFTATRVFVDCPTFGVSSGYFFPNATHFVTTGEVDIANGGVLALPNVQRLYIGGCGVCSGGNPRGLSVAGNLLVNTGETALTSFATGVNCASRNGPGAGGSTTNWTRLAVMTGPVEISGQARLCQTTVYMGRNSPNHNRQSVDQIQVAPANYPAVTRCSPTLPCPKDSVDVAWKFEVSGGAGTTDWSAPNQLSTQPTATDFVTNPLEDLALWSETSSPDVAIKGQAGNLTEGVFFLPNASARFTGQGTQPINLNAQFLIRRLDMAGQGNMFLNPNPNDAVVTPIPGAVALIR